jgi:hypothetical protein
MPTPPRTGPSRGKKKTAPAPLERQPPAEQRTTDTARAGDGPEVTASNLERREIPSFSESREARIAEAAYWRAERRGFTGGQELDDWLAAEREVDGDGAGQQSRQRSTENR